MKTKDICYHKRYLALVRMMVKQMVEDSSTLFLVNSSFSESRQLPIANVLACLLGVGMFLCILTYKSLTR
jgi:hypothetical protein